MKSNAELLTLISVFVVSIMAITPANATEIVHKFKNPSFSGQGTASHYLTVENQEFSRKKSIEEALAAAEKAAQREADNTTLAKFIRNLESRIYAQLSRQLVDALFGENPSTFGTLELMGNTIEYSVSADGTMITLKITDAEGNVTEITVPIGSFTF